MGGQMCSGYKQIVTEDYESSSCQCSRKNNSLNTRAAAKENGGPLNRRVKGKRRCSTREGETRSAEPLSPCKRLKVNQLYSEPCGRNSFMAAFFRLLDDDIIQDFLWMDGCARISDKYLLAMVYTYFKRAELPRREYNRINFFIALYLANDMEEDEEEDKYDIFPWALGERWRDTYLGFLRKKETFWRRMKYRAVVSKETCEEVMSMVPDHPIWQRTRKRHHGGAWRDYAKPSTDDSPRGPGCSPVYCSKCKENKEEDRSPFPTSDYFSSSSLESSADDEFGH